VVCRDPRRDLHVSVWWRTLPICGRSKCQRLPRTLSRPGGALSALDGVTPEKLNVAPLAARVANGIEEVILAMNATVEARPPRII